MRLGCPKPQDGLKTGPSSVAEGFPAFLFSTCAGNCPTPEGKLRIDPKRDTKGVYCHRLVLEIVSMLVVD
jgi:hypothetical protein